MTQRFRYYLRVRYQECDAQKVVFNARYGDYIDLACIEFLRAALPRPERRPRRHLRGARACARSPSGRPRPASTTCWRYRCGPSRIGTTSFTLSAEIRRAGPSD